MFTSDQIKTAHSKVKSGADFPAYVQDLIRLGVKHYETFVKDGHTKYYGQAEFKLFTEPKYPALDIAETSNAPQFRADLRAHQKGMTDYHTFCKDCVKSGVEKWVVRMDEMTCTYFDTQGTNLLVETIPQ